MSQEIKNETENVQQTAGQTGQVNNQAQTVNNIVGEAVNQPSAEDQDRERLRNLLHPHSLQPPPRPPRPRRSGHRLKTQGRLRHPRCQSEGKSRQDHYTEGVYLCTATG